MDLTNRVLIVGAALLWIFVVLLIILLAWGAPDESIARLADLTGYMDDHNATGAKLIITFGGLILAVAAVIVIIFELAPPETASLRVGNVGAGEAHISTDETARRLEEELRALPQISDVAVKVLARGRQAAVSMDLHVTPEADLAATSEEACRCARRLIEQRMAVEMKQPPRAQLHYRELSVARPWEAAPLPPTGPQQPPPGEPAALGESPRRVSWQATGPVPGDSNPPLPMEPNHEPSETSQEDRPADA
jgi:hypothetical protein